MFLMNAISIIITHDIISGNSVHIKLYLCADCKMCVSTHSSKGTFGRSNINDQEYWFNRLY